MDKDQKPTEPESQVPPAPEPQEEKKEPEPKETAKPSAEAAPSPPDSKGRILLIEDDPPMVKMYATKLEKEGFEVVIAYDGEEGLKKFEETPPDLVVLDLMIPKVGGMDLLEQLRADPKGKNLPVIILSNLSQEQDVKRSAELGVKDFLIKANFTPGQVVEKIKAYLGVS